MAADRLLIFCSAPMAGRVNTGLTPPLAPDDAAALYEASLRDVIAGSGRERARVELWYDNPSAESYFEREYPQLVRQLQTEGGLGERECDAFERSFSDGAERVVIMRGDSPTLPETHLNAAFDALREAPAVAGPAQDGGYYLMGLNASAWPGGSALFKDIDWAGADVMKQTLERAARAHLDLRLLPGWYDVEAPADLELLREDVSKNSHVGQWLNEHPNT